MGIISKLKSVLGVEDDRPAGPGDEEAPIAVTREPEAAGERAVKGGHVSREPEEDVEPPGEESSDDHGGRDDPGEPVDSIKGIGSAYARRLEAAGVRSVADLAAADPDDLAAETDLGTGRVGSWIERARARTEESRR